MSLEFAKELLGFGLADNPTDAEIKKAWKQKAIQHHPDRGGDPEVMKQINVAHDVLLGKQRPDRGRGPGGSTPSAEPRHQYSAPPPREERTTWAEAVSAARVPTGVEWRFITDPGFSRVGNDSTMGFVVYGVTAQQHVFVAVRHYQKSPNMFDNLTVDQYSMQVKTAPISESLATLAAKVIRQIWPTGIKAYNAKVKILPQGIAFDQKLSYSTNLGRSVSFKNAMDLMGQATPSSWGGKVDVVLELKDRKNMKLDEDYEVTLVLNGRPYELSEKSNRRIWQANLLRTVWGPKGYYYGGSKKTLNRIKSAKKVLGWLAQNLVGEPTELIDGLRAAADKAK